MKRLLTVFGLFAMVASQSVFAVDADREAKMEQAKKEMRALEDKEVQERRAMDDECHGKMKAMREKHYKEKEALKEKYGFNKDEKQRPDSDKRR